MLLRKMELENFRQYYGTQVVQFSGNKEKNVTLFLGENTCGKTTFIQAFRWIFFDDCEFTGKKAAEKDVLNIDVRKSTRSGESRSAGASLEFIHQGTTYVAKREYVYTSTISGDVTFREDKFTLYYYDKNGIRKMCRDGQKKLEEIMPSSLSDYFFFDGEKIADSRNTKNVKESLNRIMGLLPLERMEMHLVNGSKKSVEMQLRNSVVGSRAEEINREIGRLARRKEEVQNWRGEQEKIYNNTEEKLSDINRKLNAIESAVDDSENLKRIEQQLEKAYNDVLLAEEQVINAFVHASVEQMSAYISANIIKNLNASKFEDKGIPGMTNDSVNHILNRGRCICGMDLKEGTPCRKKVEDLLSYLPPESIGTQVRHLNEVLIEKREKNESWTSYQDKKMLYKINVEKYEELECRREEISDRLGKNKDAYRIKEDRDRLERMKKTAHENMVKYEAELQNIEKQIKSQEENLRHESGKDEYNRVIGLKIEYVRKLYARAKDEYDSQSEGILDIMRETLSDVFSSMYHGKRNIQLSDDYKVTLDVEGEYLDNSKGLDTVQNFAFISTLLKVARSRVGHELSSESYPLAMDAVFSNTDEQHIRNICSVLPNLAEQSILAITTKDWNVAEKSLDNYVGKKYRIMKESETRSIIMEVERWVWRIAIRNYLYTILRGGLLHTWIYYVVMLKKAGHIK